MAENDNPWPELVAAAKAQVDRANGDTLAAREVLRQASVALRDVLSGRLPDPERNEYVKYLLTALEQMEQGVDPAKALGLWSNNRRRTVPEERDLLMLPLAVGRQFDRIRRGIDVPPDPVSQAIRVVADRFNVGTATVRKAWNNFGGESQWIAFTSDE